GLSSFGRQRLQAGQFRLNRSVELVIELDEIIRANKLQRLRRSTVEDQFAAQQNHDPIEEPNIFHRVRCEYYGAPGLSYLAKELHDSFFCRGIQTRRWFVEKNHRGLGDQLDGDRNALSLATG